MKGYIKSSYSVYYKDIDENYLKSISPYLNKALIIRGINTLFLLFNKNQTELLKNRDIIVSQFFKYYKEKNYISKVLFEIPHIKIKVDYRNINDVDMLLKYPHFIEFVYKNNNVQKLEFNIILNEIEVKYKF